MKIGIVVTPDFFTNHVGVRNYVAGLHSLLGEGARVEFLASEKSASGGRQWYVMQPPSRRLVADNFVTKTTCLEGAPADVFSAYQKSLRHPEPELATIPKIALGSSLERENYDTILVSSPWCVDFPGRLPARQVIGLAFDTIPNTSCFTSWNTRLFEFAGQHAFGFGYYRDHCDFVYTISSDAAASLSTLFAIPQNRVIALPPFLPTGYLQHAKPNVQRGANLALACPFDPRKGMAIIPSLVNGAAAALEKVFIYGKPRCHPDLFKNFFAELDENLRIVWYPSATADVIVNLFASSRLLLFPSQSEGLGLPILEAQVCGARVAARPIPPMVQNVLSGGIELGDSIPINAAAIAAVLADDQFDHDALARQAQRRFSFDAIRSTLIATVVDQRRPFACERRPMAIRLQTA
jgi:hypothetical protein